MKRSAAVFLLILSVSVGALPQELPLSRRNFEVGLGYAYASGNGGTHGFDVGVGYYFHRRVALAANYDGLYDTSNIGTFQVTPIGNVTSKNHLQNLLIGPRVFFPGLIKTKNKTINLLNPFGEVQLGQSRLNSELIQSSSNTRTGTHDSAFTWMVGGGADVRLTPHWAARGKLGLLRTHFANAGQSKARYSLGVVYFFKAK